MSRGTETESYGIVLVKVFKKDHVLIYSIINVQIYRRFRFKSVNVNAYHYSFQGVLIRTFQSEFDRSALQALASLRVFDAVRDEWSETFA